jgi:hypothetical protein
MASTKKVLTSLHGRRVGIDAAGNLIINGRTIPSQNDTGALKVIQTTPNAVNTTATLTAAQLLAGIITSTTAAAVTGTLPTGTLLDAADNLAVDDAFEWAVIATGANAFTIAAGTDHTIVGSAVVATATSGRFRSRKTAANTFVTYRLA